MKKLLIVFLFLFVAFPYYAMGAIITGVTSSSTPSSNIAPLAAVTASSENSSSGQLAIKAIDGVIDGYPGDYTKEWATSGGGAGSWLQLDWSVSYTVDKVILYDRPNLNDNILSATLSFSDGSTLTVVPLDNAGAGTEYTFSPKVITSLRMTVNTVSGGSDNCAGFQTGIGAEHKYGEGAKHKWQ